MTSLTDVFVVVKPDMDKFGPEVKKKLGKIDARSEGKAVATRFGVGFNGAFGGVVSKSAKLLGATVAAVGIGNLIKDSVGLEAKFSQTMNTMAAVANVPKDQMKSLSDLALKMGADTTFSAVEAGDAMLELAKGGMTAATIKAGGLQGTLQLAAAGGTDLATASTIASNAMNTFALKGSDMASVAAALAGGANASSASVESLGEALSQVGPGARTAGLTLQDTVGVLSAFDAAGVKGSDAGTSLKTMLTSLVPSSNKARNAMKDLGLKFTDAKGAFLPITAVAQQLKDKLGKLSAEQKTTALSTIFGSDASRAATVLMNEGAAGIGKYIAATKDQGAAEKVAAARMSGTAGAWESFTGSVETAKLQLGLFVAPAVQAGLKGLSGLVNGIVPAAKNLAGEFKTHALPALKEFGGFVGSEVVPKLQQFGGFLVANLVPAVKNLIAAFTPLAEDVGKTAVGMFEKLAPVVVSIGTAIVSNVIPAIKDFTKFLSDNKTLVGAVAVGVGAMVVAFYAWQVALGVVSAAAKAYAVVQAALNLVLSLNPIGIIVLALVGLAAGLVYAYKNSETFRDVVNAVFTKVRDIAVGAFKAVTGAVLGAINWVKTNWPLLLAVLTGPFGLAVVVIARNWDSIKSAARIALKFVVDKFLGFAQTILDTAATAFGWVPGLGDKLKGASEAFGKFRDSVNAKLDGINDEPVDVKIGLSYTQALGQATKKMKFAAGGGVFGRGTSTSDSIPALLSNNEHVLTAKEVRGAGGHGAVEQMRSEWAKGYAKGGGVKLNPRVPSNERLTQLKEQAQFGVGWAGSSIARIIGLQLAKGQVNPGLAGALTFAKRQVGKPYGWGAVGPSAYDCSGFMSAITNVILGRKTYSRLFATGNFPTSMFARGMGAFSIGSRRGNPGHMAGTLNGVNVESRGGAGVVTGGRARGAKDRLFGGNIWHLKGYARGGAVEGDAPYDSLKNRKGLLKELGIDTFDTGGKWRSGTLGANLSGKTETVRTEAQEAALGRDTTLSRGTIADLATANKKAFKDAMNEAKFRLVGGSGGAYTLQMTNG